MTGDISMEFPGSSVYVSVHAIHCAVSSWVMDALDHVNFMDIKCQWYSTACSEAKYNLVSQLFSFLHL